MLSNQFACSSRRTLATEAAIAAACSSVRPGLSNWRAFGVLRVLGCALDIRLRAEMAVVNAGLALHSLHYMPQILLVELDRLI
jgi:hypothetical protein